MNTKSITIIWITSLIGIALFVWANSNELIQIKDYNATIKINTLTGKKCTTLNPYNLNLEKHNLPPLCKN